eukprot:PITA_28372
MLDTCQRHQIALNLKKCTFLVPFGNLLGHVVCKQALIVDPAKIVVILNLEAPRSVKQLRTTLGHTSYYRKFIKSYAQITAPMEKLLKKDTTYCWNDDCKKSLDVFKEKMASTPILVFPKWNVEFHVHVDASCIALEVVLTQEGAEGMDHPIAFASEEPTNLEGGLPDAQLFAVRVGDGHFKDIIHFLTTGTAPKEYSVQQKKELVVRGTGFSIITEHLYKMGNDEILQRHVPEFERGQILAEAHGGPAGGHYVGHATTQNILRAGLWWPTLHQDSKAYCRACDICRRTGKPSRRDEMPLNPQMTLQPSEKWTINFVGPIKPQGKTGVRYIITATEYLTQWVEAQLVKDYTTATTAKFLFDNMLTRFGCPKILMSDRRTHFLNETISALTEEF